MPDEDDWWWDDWEDDDDDDVPDDPDDYLGANYYAGQFAEMLDRFNNWLDENGFDRGTDLNQEVDSILDKYRLNTGDLSGLDDFKLPESSSPYSLLDRDESQQYHLIDPVDPRAF